MNRKWQIFLVGGFLTGLRHLVFDVVFQYVFYLPQKHRFFHWHLHAHVLTVALPWLIVIRILNRAFGLSLSPYRVAAFEYAVHALIDCSKRKLALRDKELLVPHLNRRRWLRMHLVDQLLHVATAVLVVGFCMAQ